MTPQQAELVRLGTLLYGERWQTAVSRVVGVRARQVRRWVQGSSPVPEKRLELLRAEARRRAQLLMDGGN